jgi:two-component system response regulator FlrC
VLALHSGACHVLAADDFSTAAWQLALERATQATAAPTGPTKPLAPNTGAAVRSVVYVDPVSRNLLALAQRVAQAPVAVLVEGPTGSGKEVLARVLHESSNAANGPFVGLNCAALPEHMIEDMLFGHEKGAFTGAVKEHRGLFEQAQGGTLFLDEIGELPMALQAKLLRVLQERSLVRLGGERAIALQVRVVAATNKDLRAQIAQREFREDLYFRLSTFKLRVPALAERSGDILPLVARVLARHTRAGQAWTMSEDAQRVLLSHTWPGNVRELENIIQRAMVLCTDAHIDTPHLMFDDASTSFLLAMAPQDNTVDASAPHTAMVPAAAFSAGLASASLPPSPLHAAVKHSEHHAIRAALDSSRSREEAAHKLGISPRTLRYKLARLRDTAAGLSAHS